jgi:Domain of unknown function (DUF1707)/2TM domain
MPRRRRDELTNRDRERAVDLLGAHVVSGSLSPDELAERADAVLAATTRQELGEALRDLPALPKRPVLVRAADLVSLRTHVVVYLAASAALVAVWVVTRERDVSPSDDATRLLWPFWVMFAWGVALVAHALYGLRRPLLRRARRRARVQQRREN